MKRFVLVMCLILAVVFGVSCKSSPTTPPVKILPTISNFTASPTTIQSGGSSTLSWTVKDATSITIDQGIGTVSATGTRSVSPTVTTTYTMTASNSEGQKTASCIVTVELLVQSIAVTSTTAILYIGASETFTATATMSDGSSRAITSGVWSTDNPVVASVNSAGLVTIVGSGTVNVSVTFGGKTGSKSIRGLPNYQGTWTGTYRIDSCSATGDFYLADFCSYLPTGTVLNTDLVLTQNQDQVTGRFYLGTLSADGIGPVAMNGQLTLTGKVYGDITIDAFYLLQSTTPGQITGGLNQLWQGIGAGLSGDVRLTCTIVSLSRTSLTPNEPAFAGTPVKTSTIQDMIRALLRR